MHPDLTILNVAYPLALVGPDAVGGAEQVLTQLDAALTRAGHRSLVIAGEGSTTHGTLLATPPCHGPLNDHTRREAAEHHRNAIARALQHWPVDVVHLHGVDFSAYLPPPGVPVLATLHLPPEWYPREIFRLERPRTHLQCVSAVQRRACPASPLLLPEIENGVPQEFSTARHAKGRFALSLGRVCPEKGFHLALQAAARVHTPLLLAGKVFRYAAHERYFEQEIVPRLDRWRRFLGPVGLKRKRRLLAAARCLVAPSLVPETSSLAAMEALACGTPVVAFPAGALAEIVEHGKTGFLVKNESELAEAIHRAGSLEPEACRQSARRRFTTERMVQQYFALYRQMANMKNTECAQREADGCGSNNTNGAYR
jgi:glycosyltransferase involved in cell wall biosynthesis